MSQVQASVDSVIALALIAAYVALSVTHNDGTPVLLILSGYVGKTAATTAVEKVQQNGDGKP